MLKSTPVNTIFLVLSLLVFTIVSQPVVAKEMRYTKFNIHTQTKDNKTYKASYANYTDPGEGHVVIAAGTEISIIKKTRKSFTFTCDNDTKNVVYEFHDKRMAMSLDDYLEKITSAGPVSFDELSKKDREGMADGKAYKGMSRKGVMVALGYPAAHRTPSIDSDSWTYWTNRFKTIVVEFDDKGLVSEVRR